MNERATQPAAAPASRYVQSAEPLPDSILAGVGWLLIVVGFIAMAVGLLSPTTITTESTYLLGERIGGDTVHNIGLIARNLGVLLAGGFTAVLGGLLITVGRLTLLAERQSGS